MSVASTGAGVKNLAIGVAIFTVVAGLVYLYSKRKEIADAVDITSDKNLAYRGASAVTRVVTGDKQATVGTAAFGLVDSVKGWFGASEDDKREAAAISACNVAWAKYGKVGSAECLALKDAGKLTPPSESPAFSNW